jgi:hypothetical protein
MDANEQAVRTFAASVFRARTDFQSGVGPVDPLPLILAEARTVAASVDKAISRRSWYGLQHVLPELTAECDGDPVVALFAWLAIQCAHASEELESGASEDDVKRRLDACVRDAVKRLY